MHPTPLSVSCSASSMPGALLAATVVAACITRHASRHSLKHDNMRMTRPLPSFLLHAVFLSFILFDVFSTTGTRGTAATRPTPMSGTTPDLDEGREAMLHTRCMLSSLPMSDAMCVVCVDMMCARWSGI